MEMSLYSEEYEANKRVTEARISHWIY